MATIATATAQAPTYAPQALSGIPATLATTADTNFASMPIIDVRKQQKVAVTFSFTQTSASTSNVLYGFKKSVDGVNIDNTSPNWLITIPSQGATRVNYTTNLDVGGIGFLHLACISNTTALTTWTNRGITYGIKISAP